MRSWIKATISTPIQAFILSCSTSLEAWKLLEKRLSPISKTHIRTTCDELHFLKKESDKPIADYLLHAKTFADSLATTDSLISDFDLIKFVTDGLGQLMKNSLHIHQITSFDELYDLAILEEHLLK